MYSYSLTIISSSKNGCITNLQSMNPNTPPIAKQLAYSMNQIAICLDYVFNLALITIGVQND